MPLEWNDSLATGIYKVDNQHKELISRAAELEAAIDKPECDVVVAELIGFLENYVIEHFADEEALMERYHYPAITGHKIQHGIFLKAFAEIKARFEQEGCSPMLKNMLQMKLNAWLLNHIHSVDKRMALYMQEQGVLQAAR